MPPRPPHRRPAAPLAALRAGPALLLLACGGPGDPKPGAADPGPDSAAPDALDCDGAPRPPRALRLLTRREYQATVTDLFTALSGEEPVACDEDADCDLRTQTCDAGTCAALPCGTVGFSLPFSADGGAAEVVVAGDFNGWATAAGGWPLARDAAAGAWRAQGSPGEGTFRYKLVLDGSTWIRDPTNPWAEDDGYGGENSVIEVDCSGDGGALVPAVDAVADFPVETRVDGHLFDNSVDGGLVTTPRLEAFVGAAGALAAQLTAARAQVVGCGDLSDDACLGAFFDRAGRRAFRRPLEPAERDRFVGLVREEANPADGLELALTVMLASPHLLYRSELGEARGDGVYALTAWETASLLSYTLWGSAPDEALLQAAEAGQLATAEGRAAEAARLLAHPRARARLGWFGVQWLDVDKVPTMHKAAERYPAWSPALADAMAAEAAARVSAELIGGEGTLPGLLVSPRSSVNAELAALYGVDPPAAGWADVVLPPSRAGVLGMAGVLAATAHSDQTSPVRRGLWVRGRLLCQDLGTPPANAGGVPEVDPGASTRDRFDQHSSDPACSSCHQYIDPVGFGFEHFDPVGAWRDTDEGNPIDARGEVLGMEGIGQAERLPFDGVAELAALVAASDAAPACFTRTTWAWALGADAVDACDLDASTLAFRAAGQRHDALIDALVRSPAFVEREEP
jgi:hypothetical protein